MTRLNLNLYQILILLFLVGVSACSDDSPTGTGTWDQSLVLFPANEAILTEGVNVSVQSFGADSMVAYLIDERGIIRYVRVGGGGTPPLADVVKPLLSSSAHKAPS